MAESRLPGFDDREKSQERKFQQEQELAFRLRARRNKLLGQWAAGRMGLAGDAAEAYAAALVAAAVERGDDAAILTAIGRDLAAKGVGLDEEAIRRELARCAQTAKRELGAPE